MQEAATALPSPPASPHPPQPWSAAKALVNQAEGKKRERGRESRFAGTLAPEYEEAKAHLGSMARCEEDVLSYIAFPQQAEQYFQRRENTFTAGYTFKEVV